MLHVRHRFKSSVNRVFLHFLSADKREQRVLSLNVKLKTRVVNK